MGKDCIDRKYGNKKKKAEKTIDGDDDDLVLGLLTTKNKKLNVKKKVQFTEDIIESSEVGIMCTNDGDTFFHSQRTPGLETPMCHVTSQMKIPVFSTSSYQQVDSRKLQDHASYEERQASHQCLTS